ncbi:MAG: hypothetical protein RIT25_1659 [Planctomycetota bacterium]
MATHHDALFRAAFAEPRVAAAWIRSVVPAAVASMVDWKTLAIARTETLGHHLRRSVADLVFEADLVDGLGRVQFPIEHKSGSGEGAQHQLLRYAVEQQRWCANTTQRLVVVAILLRHGPRPLSRKLPNRHDSDPRLDVFAPMQPHLLFHIDDLAAASEDALRARGMHPLATLVLLALRTLPHLATVGEVLDALHRWRDLIEAVWRDEGPPSPAAILEALGWYVQKTTDVTEEQLPSELKQPQTDEHGERMTTAERIVREARAAGQLDAERRTLLRQLERRFGTVPAAVAERIHSAALPQLEAWLDRIFDLRAPEDLLAQD